MPNVVCCGCSAVNRIPVDRPAGAARCGRCGARLFSGAPCEVSSIGLDAQVARSDVPIVLDVWAPWCGPCRTMAPAYEAAARELEPEFRLLKLDSEAEPGAAARLDVRAIPTLILFRNGKEVARQPGAMPASRIVAWARAEAAGRHPA